MPLNLERVACESPSETVTLSKDLKEVRSRPCGCLRESFSGSGDSQCETLGNEVGEYWGLGHVGKSMACHLPAIIPAYFFTFIPNSLPLGA